MDMGVEQVPERRYPTLLAQLVAHSERTEEEIVREYLRCARQHGEGAALSTRTLRRWMGGHVTTQPRPAQRRVARLYWGHGMEELLAPPQALAYGSATSAESAPLGGWTALLRQSMIERISPTGEPPSVGALETTVCAGNIAYQSARYSQLRRLPVVVLGHVEALVANPTTSDLPRLARLITSAYLLAAKFAAKLGDGDTAWVAADRANSFSLMTGQPEYPALAAYQMACALAKQPGRLADAERVAVTAADRIGSQPAGTNPSGISARGALLLHAAIVAAHQHHPQDADIYLQDASAEAHRLGRDANEMWTAFGPTNVILHRVSAAVALHDTPEALRLADGIDPSKFPDNLVSRRAQIHLDLGAAHAAGNASAHAMLHLLEFERIAPEAVSHNGTAANLIRALLAHERSSQTPGLRALAHRAGVLA